MITFPNAKINLGLFITDKRSDGYHSIESVFYPIRINDILEVGVFEKISPVLQITGIAIEGDSDQNLVSKSIRLIHDYLLKNNLLDRSDALASLRFNLHKIIPTGAGLGGGSADGTFALKAINEILSLNLTTETLEKMALELGSDCPFFVKNQPALVKGRGEIIEKFDLDLSGYHLILIHPGIHISTQEAYSEVRPQASKIDWKTIQKGTIKDWSKTLNNDFESTVFKNYMKIKEIKDSLYQRGAIYAQMSGSGSAVYGIFDQKQELDFLPEFTTRPGFKLFQCDL